ncbi:MAG: FMN-binding protein [Clostridiales bacterium]|nr:FMN-binding protein [Clostridiales bacterium]
MKKEFVLPILVLTLICLFISAALAITNNFTGPVIAKAAADRAEAARSEVIPEADSFELLQVEGLPQTVREVYKTTNNAGYVFMLTVSGYGGDINIICGIAPDGTIISAKTLAHTETKGMGSKITEEPFAGQFPGKDASLEGVDAISGATISSRAYINAVKDAVAAYEIVKGVQ